MALMFKAVARSEGKTLNGGQFITTIAENLGRLTARVKKSFGRPSRVEVKGYWPMSLAMIFKKLDDGSYVLYEENEGKQGGPAADLGEGPSSSRNTRRRGSERSGREQVPINLAHTARQNDQLGYYNDDIQRMYMEVGTQMQDLRLHFGMPSRPFQGYPFWDERMGYTQQGQGQGSGQEGDEDDEGEE